MQSSLGLGQADVIDKSLFNRSIFVAEGGM